MLRAAVNLHGYNIEATDGKIGEVREFFFDDDYWTVRYLVVDTGSWLVGRRVLISPMSITQVDWDHGLVRVNLTRQQVEDCPDVDTQQPFSRQMEIKYNNYYRLPMYWYGPGVWGLGAYPAGNISQKYWQDQNITDQELRTIFEKGEDSPVDTHLRSSREVKGYRIDAKDDRFGHIEDFIVDDQTWQIRYLVVDTVNYWPSKSVLISPDWVNSIHWEDREIQVDLTKDQIKSSPKYNPDQLIDREYEELLYQHYGLEQYWISGSDRSPHQDPEHPMK